MEKVMGMMQGYTADLAARDVGTVRRLPRLAARKAARWCWHHRLTASEAGSPSSPPGLWASVSQPGRLLPWWWQPRQADDPDSPHHNVGAIKADVYVAGAIEDQ